MSVTSNRRCRCSAGRPTPNQNQKNGPGGRWRSGGKGRGMAVVPGRHASWGSRACQSGHGPLQAELTGSGPRHPGFRLGGAPPAASGGFPCNLAAPARPGRSDVRILQGGLCPPAGSAIVCRFHLLESESDWQVLSSSAPHAAAFQD